MKFVLALSLMLFCAPLTYGDEATEEKPGIVERVAKKTSGRGKTVKITMPAHLIDPDDQVLFTQCVGEVSTLRVQQGEGALVLVTTEKRVADSMRRGLADDVASSVFAPTPLGVLAQLGSAAGRGVANRNANREAVAEAQVHSCMAKKQQEAMLDAMRQQQPSAPPQVEQ